MSFGGHAAAMISSLKNNRALRKRKSLKEKRIEAFSHLGDITHKPKKLQYKKASPEEMAANRKKISKDLAKERFKQLVFIVSFSIITIALFYFIFYYMGVV